jgi:hypothetical protein
MPREAFGPREEGFHFLMKNVLQILLRNLIPALAAEVFGILGPDIHFVAAGAVQQGAKQLHRRFRELEKEVLDLKITNRGKDYFIDQLQKERTANLEQIVSFSRKVGEMESKLLQPWPPGDISMEAK